jgi:hypothetical protein
MVGRAEHQRDVDLDAVIDSRAPRPSAVIGTLTTALGAICARPALFVHRRLGLGGLQEMSPSTVSVSFRRCCILAFLATSDGFVVTPTTRLVDLAISSMSAVSRNNLMRTSPLLWCLQWSHPRPRVGPRPRISAARKVALFHDRIITAAIDWSKL